MVPEENSSKESAAQDPQAARGERSEHGQSTPLSTATIHLGRTAQEQLRMLFEGYVREIFLSDLGVSDQGVVDYVTSILERNIRVGDLFDDRFLEPSKELRGAVSIPDHLGLMLRYCNQLESSSIPQLDTLGDMYAAVGDVVLFIGSLYSEAPLDRAIALHSMQMPDRVKNFIELGEVTYQRAAESYQQHGKHGYNDLYQENNRARISIVEFLGDNFRDCVRGLRDVRDHLFYLISERRVNGLILGR